MSLKETLLDYLRFRVANGRPVISSHELEEAKDWIFINKQKRTLTDSVSRCFRSLRESGEIEVFDSKMPHSKEGRWTIRKINT